METWEVVSIVALITVAVLVVAKHQVPLSFIGLLDNTLFQLAILGATLAVAAISPAVAIVAIATVVIVYYIRNLVKVQIAMKEADYNKMVTDQMVEDNSPRIEIHEQTAVQQITSTSVTITPPVSTTELPAAENRPHDATNRDVIENAMKEHESRPPLVNVDVGSRSSVSAGGPAMKSVEAPAHEDMPNPRGDMKHTEPFDTQADFHSTAPAPGADVLVHTPKVDSDVFTTPLNQLDAYNEQQAAPFVRGFADSAGQYNIGETRPHSNYGKFELADYQPGNDLGLNEFKQLGVSIDDKVNNLKLGINPSSAPPPNFDQVMPPRVKNTA